MKTQTILKIMYFFAWAAIIGLSIQAGSILLSYLISFSNEGAAKDLYQGLNLLEYKQSSVIQYTLVVANRLLQFCIQAYIAFLVTQLLSKLNIERPFNAHSLKLMRRTSYSLLLLWAVVVGHNVHVGILEASTGIPATLISSEFVYFAGIVYVFSLLFKRGLELQTENDLMI